MSATRKHWLQVINGASSVQSVPQHTAVRGRVHASGAVEDSDKGIRRRVKVLTPEMDKTPVTRRPVGGFSRFLGHESKKP